jgi:hypothetical protein
MLSLVAKVVFEPGDTQSSHGSNRAVFKPGSVRTGQCSNRAVFEPEDELPRSRGLDTSHSCYCQTRRELQTGAAGQCLTDRIV